MSLKVKRVFGGFEVQTESGETVKRFQGAGAKHKAENYAALNPKHVSETTPEDVGYIGNTSRGGQRGGRA